MKKAYYKLIDFIYKQDLTFRIVQDDLVHYPNERSDAIQSVQEFEYSVIEIIEGDSIVGTALIHLRQAPQHTVVQVTGNLANWDKVKIIDITDMVERINEIEIV